MSELVDAFNQICDNAEICEEFYGCIDNIFGATESGYWRGGPEYEKVDLIEDMDFVFEAWEKCGYEKKELDDKLPELASKTWIATKSAGCLKPVGEESEGKLSPEVEAFLRAGTRIPGMATAPSAPRDFAAEYAKLMADYEASKARA